MHYFSYGSNMSFKRLHHRVPSISSLGMAVLREHRLKFHKIGSKDGSAKCDAEATGNPEHAVFGVLYEMAASARQGLDRVEGLGCGYEEKTVLLELPGGNQLEAVTYYATHIDPLLKTFHWYKEHVLRGAREHHLPQEYIQMIEAIESVADIDVQRQEQELSIYR